MVNFTFKSTEALGSPGVGWSRQVGPWRLYGCGSDLEGHEDVDSHRVRHAKPQLPSTIFEIQAALSSAAQPFLLPPEYKPSRLIAPGEEGSILASPGKAWWPLENKQTGSLSSCACVCSHICALGLC